MGTKVRLTLKKETLVKQLHGQGQHGEADQEDELQGVADGGVRNVNLPPISRSRIVYLLRSMLGRSPSA